MDYTAYLRIAIPKVNSSLLDEVSFPIKIAAMDYNALKALAVKEKPMKQRTILMDNKGNWIASKKEK